jgi:seryl-tRNA synthetase
MCRRVLSERRSSSLSDVQQSRIEMRLHARAENDLNMFAELNASGLDIATRNPHGKP